MVEGPWAVNITDVFLSSTTRDLEKYRDVVGRAIKRLNGFRVNQMEDWGALAEPPREACRRKIAGCDVVVLLAGHFYGSYSEATIKSFTEFEYECAIEAKKNVLVFLASEDFPIPSNLVESDELRERQRRFRKRLLDGHTSSIFRGKGDLAQGVVTTLANWKEELFGVMLRQTQQSREMDLFTSGVSGRHPSTADSAMQPGAGPASDNRKTSAIDNPPAPIFGQLARALLPSDEELPSSWARVVAGREVLSLSNLFDLQQWDPDQLLRGYIRSREEATTIGELIRERLGRVLAFDVADILVAAWQKSETLRGYLRRSQVTGKEIFLQLAEHRVSWAYHPEWQFSLRGQEMPSLRLNARLDLLVSGGVLRLAGGRILDAQVGEMTSGGAIDINGTAVAEVAHSVLSTFSLRPQDREVD